MENIKKIIKKTEEIEDYLDCSSEEDLVPQTMEPLNDDGDLKRMVSLMADVIFLENK